MFKGLKGTKSTITALRIILEPKTVFLYTHCQHFIKAFSGILFCKISVLLTQDNIPVLRNLPEHFTFICEIWISNQTTIANSIGEIW